MSVPTLTRTAMNNMPICCEHCCKQPGCNDYLKQAARDCRRTECTRHQASSQRGGLTLDHKCCVSLHIQHCQDTASAHTALASWLYMPRLTQWHFGLGLVAMESCLCSGWHHPLYPLQCCTWTAALQCSRQRPRTWLERGWKPTRPRLSPPACAAKETGGGHVHCLGLHLGRYSSVPFKNQPVESREILSSS